MPCGVSVTHPETWLITGASSGLGEAIARHLATHHHKSLVLTARRRERLEALAVELPGSHTALALDLVHPDTALHLYDALVDTPLEGVVLCGAAYHHGSFAEAEPAALESMLDTNIHSNLRLLDALLPVLDAKARPTYVLVVGSFAGLIPAPGSSTYAASKAWLHHFVEGLQIERGRRPPTSITLGCPGGMPTPMLTTSPGWAKARRHVLVRASLLPVERVARTLIRGTLRRRRRVIPGVINTLSLAVLSVTPRWIRDPLLRWIYG